VYTYVCVYKDCGGVLMDVSVVPTLFCWFGVDRQEVCLGDELFKELYEGS